MDTLAKESLSRFYIYCYDQLLQVNIALPAPQRVFGAVGTAADYVRAYSPEVVQSYYARLASAPVQANIIPVFLALVVLYTIFSLILMTIRGVFRVVYNFVRFTIILAMLVALYYVLQQYLAAGYNLSPPELLEQLWQEHFSSLPSMMRQT